MTKKEHRTGRGLFLQVADTVAVLWLVVRAACTSRPAATGVSTEPRVTDEDRRRREEERKSRLQRGWWAFFEGWLLLLPGVVFLCIPTDSRESLYFTLTGASLAGVLLNGIAGYLRLWSHGQRKAGDEWARALSFAGWGVPLSAVLVSVAKEAVELTGKPIPEWWAAVSAVFLGFLILAGVIRLVYGAVRVWQTRPNHCPDEQQRVRLISTRRSPHPEKGDRVGRFDCRGEFSRHSGLRAHSSATDDDH